MPLNMALICAARFLLHSLFILELTGTGSQLLQLGNQLLGI